MWETYPRPRGGLGARRTAGKENLGARGAVSGGGRQERKL